MTTSATTTIVKETVPKLPLFNRVKEALKEYLHRLKNDYKGSFEDAITDSKAKPHKALTLLSVSIFSTYAFMTNPSKESFRRIMAEKRTKMALIPPTIHNPKTVDAINEREKLFIQKRLKFIDFFLFTLVVKTKFDSTLYTAESQDPNLKDWYWNEILKNIVDIGAFNKFWYLEKAMNNCDINDNEFVNNVVV
uniref:Peroxisomal membrane protein PEX31 n=1 Tax=Parastrongyloides trichosuri TaxID=131310 RepID=A0A0N4ZR98_PARTI